MTAPGILRLVVTFRAKKMQKFVLRSALRSNQISFLHGLGHKPKSPSRLLCQLPPAADIWARKLREKCQMGSAANSTVRWPCGGFHKKYSEGGWCTLSRGPPPHRWSLPRCSPIPLNPLLGMVSNCNPCWEKRGPMKFSTLAALVTVTTVGTAAHAGCGISTCPTDEQPTPAQHATEVTVQRRIENALKDLE